MKAHEAVTHFASMPDGEAALSADDVGTFASAASGGVPAFWKSLVISGLSIIHTALKLDGEQSAAWDTVVALIQAL